MYHQFDGKGFGQATASTFQKLRKEKVSSNIMISRRVAFLIGNIQLRAFTLNKTYKLATCVTFKWYIVTNNDQLAKNELRPRIKQRKILKKDFSFR